MRRRLKSLEAHEEAWTIYCIVSHFFGDANKFNSISTTIYQGQCRSRGAGGIIWDKLENLRHKTLWNSLGLKRKAAQLISEHPAISYNFTILIPFFFWLLPLSPLAFFFFLPTKALIRCCTSELQVSHRHFYLVPTAKEAQGKLGLQEEAASSSSSSSVTSLPIGRSLTTAGRERERVARDEPTTELVCERVTWYFTLRRARSTDVGEQVVDVGDGLRLHGALLLGNGLTGANVTQLGPGLKKSAVQHA